MRQNVLASTRSTAVDGFASPVPPLAGLPSPPNRSRSTPARPTPFSPVSALSHRSADFATEIEDELEAKLRRPTSRGRLLPSMDYTGFINTRANHRVSHAAEIHAKNFVAALMQAPPTRGPEGSPPHSRVAIQQKMMQLEHKVQNTLAKRQARQKLEKEGDDGNRLENRVQQLERLVRDKEQQALRDALCQKETAGRTAITQIEHAEWVQVQHEHWAVKTNILADANYYEEQVVRKALINLEQDIRGDLKQKMEVKLAVVKQHAMLRDAQVRRQRQQAEDLEERNRMRLVAQIQLEISEYLLPGVEEAQTLHRAVVIRTATEAHERIFQKKRVAELAPEFVRNRDKWLEGIQAQQQMVVLSAELGARLSIVTEARTLGVALLDGVVTGEEFGRAWLLQQQDAQAQALAGSFCSDAAQIRRSAISKDWETKARQLVAKEAAAFAQITLLFEETAQRTELSAALTRVLSGSILGLVGLEEVYYRLAHSAKEDWQAQLLWCQILESETRTILGAEATQGMLVRVLSFAELEEQRCRLALQESEVAKLPLIGCQSEECQRRASIAEEWWEGCVQINKATVEECSSQRSADSAAHEMANRRALVDKAAHTYATIQHDFLLGCEELGRKGVIREACVAELQHLVEAESFALRLQMAAECSARTSVLAQAQAEVAELQIKAQSVSWAANLEVQIDAESVARAAVLEEEQKVAAQLQPRRDFSGSLDAEKALELQVKEYDARTALDSQEMEARVRMYVYEADEKFADADPYDEDETMSVVSGWTGRRSEWTTVKADVPLNVREEESRCTLCEAQQSEWVAILLLANSDQQAMKGKAVAKHW